MPIPPTLNHYFWDCDVKELSWNAQRDFITRRLLQEGDLAALRWLRNQWGDDGLKEWLVSRQGRGLSPRQLRYWGEILDIDPGQVDDWVKREAGSIWENRNR